MEGPDAALNTWTITADDSANIVSNGTTYTFSDFQNWIGGEGNSDVFVMDDAYEITGSLNGGGGTQNSLDYSSFTAPVTIDLQNGSATNVHSGDAGYVSNFNIGIGTGTLIGSNGDDTFILTTEMFELNEEASVDGRGGNNTLIGPNSYNIWSITSNNAGSLNGEVTFINIQNVTGRNYNDEFYFQGNSSIDGYLNGGGGENYVYYNDSTFNPIYIDWVNRTAPGMKGWSNISGFFGVTYQLTVPRSRQLNFALSNLNNLPSQITNKEAPQNIMNYKEYLHSNEILYPGSLWYERIINSVKTYDASMVKLK
jgi:hypothetical protein